MGPHAFPLHWTHEMAHPPLVLVDTALSCCWAAFQRHHTIWEPSCSPKSTLSAGSERDGEQSSLAHVEVQSLPKQDDGHEDMSSSCCSAVGPGTAQGRLAFPYPHSPCLYWCPSPCVLFCAAREECSLGMVTALWYPQACLFNLDGRVHSLTLGTLGIDC